VWLWRKFLGHLTLALAKSSPYVTVAPIENIKTILFEIGEFIEREVFGHLHREKNSKLLSYGASPI